MKMCSDCNVVMIDNCELEGQLKFKLGADGESRVSLTVPTGENASLFGLPIDVRKEACIRGRMCPNCGKVELYVNLNELR